jgi:RNA polymerase sigma-70 factor (ECF subfamily)
VRDLYPYAQAAIGEDELFDRLAALDVADLTQDLETNEEVSAMLALVSDDDRRVLRLAVLYDLNGEELAQALGVTSGAARVRLHRALNRLRQAWQAQQGDEG